MIHLVLTLIGPDRPGLVGAVAGIVASHGGGWLESRMTRLGGKFAGILRAELPPDRVPGAIRAFADLEKGGLRIVVETEERAERESTRGLLRMELEVIGVDRPGIVREIADLLAAAAVNVEELVTHRRSAPMSGETLFEAHASVHVPATTDVARLRQALDRAARDLMVDVRLDDAASDTEDAGER